MTKVSVLSRETHKTKTLKKIELTHCLVTSCDSFNFGKGGDSLDTDPNSFDELILISSQYDYDIILCVNSDDEALYFGQWNDGIV